jgi:4-amino-4-deoxy-L-arabinose transferase-like glycosyltransferase
MNQDQDTSHSRRQRWAIFLTLWYVTTLVFLITPIPDEWFIVAVGSVFLILTVRFIYTQPSLNLHQHDANIIHYRLYLTILFTVLAVLLMYQSATYLVPNAPTADLKIALYYLIVGFIGIGIATLLSFRHLPLPLPTTAHLSRPTTNWILASVGLLALATLTEANCHLLGISQLENLVDYKQFALLITGLFFLTWGLGGGDIPRRFPRIVTPETFAVLALTLLALILRLWHLETAVHKFIDELNFAAFTLKFEDTNTLRLLRPEILAFPNLYAFLQYIGTQIWGHNLFAVRIVSAVFGTLTIPALYLLARQLFDAKTALIAALLLAVFPPHIHHSRLALNNIADPFFGTLALAFIARGLRQNRRLDFAIAGTSLGLTQYFYEGGRLLYPPLILAWLLMGFCLWRPRPQFRSLLIVVLAALVVSAPIYVTLYTGDFATTTRFDQESSKLGYESIITDSTTRDQYLFNLKRTVLLLVSQPEERHFYYGGTHALLMPFLLPFFLLGIAFTICRFYTPAILIVLWLIATAVGNSLLNDPALTTRYVVVFPALVLLVAVGLSYTTQLLWHPRLSIRYQSIALTVLVGAFALVQIHDYFGPHLDFYNVQIRYNFTYDGEDAVFRAADFEYGTQVIIFSDNAIDRNYGLAIFDYLARSALLYTISPQTLTELRIANIPQTMDNAFFVEPDDEQTIRWLHKYFVLEEPTYSPYNVPSDQQLVLYYAPAHNQ